MHYSNVSQSVCILESSGKVLKHTEAWALSSVILNQSWEVLGI